MAMPGTALCICLSCPQHPWRQGLGRRQKDRASSEPRPCGPGYGTHAHPGLVPSPRTSRLRLRGATPRGPGAAGASPGIPGLHTPVHGPPQGPQELAGLRGSRQLIVEHLHVIWERVTCGSHQAEERLNQGLITVCLEGSGSK